MSQKYFKENLIVLRQRDSFYKISKITPHSDGGFNILMPYCSIKKGYIFKADVSYSQFSKITRDKIIQEFTIDNDTKLSIHKSGFVQFSGSGILSGIDESTGKIKGVGVFSEPLTRPITSGPTFGFHLWGLPCFEKLDGVKKNVNKIIFEEDDLYYRYGGELPSDIIEDAEDIDWESYIIEGFYFGNDVLPFVKYDGGRPVISVRFPNFEIPNSIFKMKVIFLKNSPGFIGLIVSKTYTIHKKSEKTGYILTGPTGNIRGRKGNMIGTAIFCAYPMLTRITPQTQSLSYVESSLPKQKINKNILREVFDKVSKWAKSRCPLRFRTLFKKDEGKKLDILIDCLVVNKSFLIL